MIQRSFSLRTDLFEASTPGPNFINDRCFGEDFALWFSNRLQVHGLTPSEPIQEDWGWVLLVPFQGHKFSLSIGIMDESIGHVPSEWLNYYCVREAAHQCWFMVSGCTFGRPCAVGRDS